MLPINETLSLAEDELSWSYARSGGPGGQNVNKVASKAVLRWSMAASPSIPAWVKQRVQTLFPSRVTIEGDVVISSQEYRDQERNRAACVTKLIEMVRAALEVPKPRVKPKPTFRSQLRRLEDKRRQAQRRRDRDIPE